MLTLPTFRHGQSAMSMLTPISQASSLAALNESTADTAASTLGVVIVASGPDFMVAEMPVDERTKQPFGLLHGGASMVLAETLGSLASAVMVRAQGGRPMGVEVGGRHVRPARAGVVTGICRPVRLGRSMHFWRVEIFDEACELVCDAQLTVKIFWPRQAGRDG